MLLLWSLVLYVIVIFGPVIADSSTDKGQKTADKNVNKDTQEDDVSSSEEQDDEKRTDVKPLHGHYEEYYDYREDNRNIEAHESFLADESSSQESIEKRKKGLLTRSLRAGDTFTPQELMPVVKKLLSKVDNPGEGRGIVSSSKSPEDLADRLFAGYFLTMKRIVFLDEKDLAGLDALQALALEGDDAISIRAAAESITEAPMKIIDYGGQLIGVHKYPGRCHYKLINKKVEPKPKPEVANDAKENVKSVLRTGQRISKLEKHMRPNRHLIVKYGRKSNNGTNVTLSSDEDKLTEKGKNIRRRRHKTNKSHMKGGKRKLRRKRRQKKNRVRDKKSKLKRKQRDRKDRGIRNGEIISKRINNVEGQVTTTVKPKCKWRYHCRTPGDLDSCRLRTECYDEYNPKAYVDEFFVDHRPDEHDESVKQFRKMLGITLLDEDVEKIIEQHVIQVKPENMRGIEKLETLDEYFNNIIMAQNAKTTTPFPHLDTDDSSIEKSTHKDMEIVLSKKKTPSPEIHFKSSVEQNDDDPMNKIHFKSSVEQNDDDPMNKIYFKSSAEQSDDTSEDKRLRASGNKEKHKETNSTSQSPDKNITTLPTVSTTKS